MKVTTINITAVRLSNKKPQYIFNILDSIQGNNVITQILCDKTISKNIINENIADKLIKKVVTIAAPCLPINLPKKLEQTNPINGKKIIDKYIKLTFYWIYKIYRNNTFYSIINH